MQKSPATTTYNRFMAFWILSATIRVSQLEKKHSPTHTYRGHQSSLICFLHLVWSTAHSLFNLRAWQSFCTVSLQVFFGLPLGLTSPKISSKKNEKYVEWSCQKTFHKKLKFRLCWCYNY